VLDAAIFPVEAWVVVTTAATAATSYPLMIEGGTGALPYARTHRDACVSMYHPKSGRAVNLAAHCVCLRHSAPGATGTGTTAGKTGSIAGTDTAYAVWFSEASGALCLSLLDLSAVTSSTTTSTSTSTADRSLPLVSLDFLVSDGDGAKSCGVKSMFTTLLTDPQSNSGGRTTASGGSTDALPLDSSATSGYVPSECVFVCHIGDHVFCVTNAPTPAAGSKSGSVPASTSVSLSVAGLCVVHAATGALLAACPLSTLYSATATDTRTDHDSAEKREDLAVEVEVKVEAGYVERAYCCSLDQSNHQEPTIVVMLTSDKGHLDEEASASTSASTSTSTSKPVDQPMSLSPSPARIVRVELAEVIAKLKNT
jgi:hypothetical protein